MEEENNPSNASPQTNEDQLRTLYIGNLNCSTTEDALKELFGKFGSITKSELTSNALSELYAFIEFTDHSSAKKALKAMNKKKKSLDDGMIVIWAQSPAPEQRKEINNKDQFKVFVGNLSSEIDDHALTFAFTRCGDVLESRVIVDPYTSQSRGYGFVTFSRLEDVERAMKEMNGQLLDNRTIRVNRAHSVGPIEKDSYELLLSYEDIFYQTGVSNTSVYVGNVPQIAIKEEIRSAFTRFGNIVDVRYYNSHGNAFIKFDSKESATKAIYEMNGFVFMEQPIRCSWGTTDNGKLEEQPKEVNFPPDVHSQPINNVVEEQRLPRDGFEEFIELYQKGMLEMNDGHFDEAIINFSKAIQSLDAFYKSTMAKLLSKCAKVHVSCEDYKLAIIDAEKSLELDPTLKEAYRQRLLSHFELGNREEAFEDLKKIVQL